jgi:hypothetical protein
MSDSPSIKNTQPNNNVAEPISSKQNGESLAPAPTPDQSSSSTQAASHAPSQPQPIPESDNDDKLSEPPVDASMEESGDLKDTTGVVCRWDSLLELPICIPHIFITKKSATSFISQVPKPKTERQLMLDNEKAERAIARNVCLRTRNEKPEQSSISSRHVRTKLSSLTKFSKNKNATFSRREKKMLAGSKEDWRSSRRKSEIPKERNGCWQNSR